MCFPVLSAVCCCEEPRMSNKRKMKSEVKFETKPGVFISKQTAAANWLIENGELVAKMLNKNDCSSVDTNMTDTGCALNSSIMSKLNLQLKYTDSVTDKGCKPASSEPNCPLSDINNSVTRSQSHDHVLHTVEKILLSKIQEGKLTIRYDSVKSEAINTYKKLQVLRGAVDLPFRASRLWVNAFIERAKLHKTKRHLGGDSVCLKEQSINIKPDLFSEELPLQVCIKTPDDIKTEDICWVSETVSSEDSSHSANPLALEDESNPIPEAPSCSTTLLEPSLIISDVLPSSSKEAEITPVPTVTLATNILPPPNQQLVPSQTALSSSNELVASPTHILGTDMMLPPKQLVLSKSVLSTEQGSCVNQSLSITNNKSGVENIPLEVCEVSFEPANKQLELDETLPNTDRIDTALRRLEDISDKVNQLNETNDNFDSFGRYVASLLRSLPIQNVVTVQQDVLSLIFRSCAQPPADQDEPTKGTSTLDKVPGTSSVTQNSSGEPPNSTETQQIPQNSSVASPKLAETQQPPPSTSPTPQNTSVHQCISVAQQNVKRNKRSHVECEILPEIRTKQSKIDESLIHTNQIDASLKRLKDISKRVKESSLWDDAFDKFGRYIASLLRCTDPQSTIGLQNEIVDLIMKSRALHLDHV